MLVANGDDNAMRAAIAASAHWESASRGRIIELSKAGAGS